MFFLANLSNKEITSIISDCLKYSPSAFNYPTTNVIIAFGEKHQQIWQITTDILKEKLAKKEETFAVAQNKINKLHIPRHVFSPIYLGYYF